MGRFNERGDVTSVYRPWLTQDDQVFQECADGTCVVLRSNGEVLKEHAANIVLGSGHGGWAGWEKHPEGAFDFLGRTFPSGVPMAIGPDNAIALKLDHFSTGPFDVVEADSSRWRLSDSDIYDVQLIGHQRAIWMGMDRHVRANFEAMLPLRLCWWARYAAGVFLVQDIDTGCLALDGHVLRPSGDYFFGDLLRLENGWRVTYSPNEADENRVVFNITDAELAALPLVGTPADPVDDPVDPIDPPKEPNMDLQKLLTPRLDIVRAVHRDYPNLDAGDSCDQVIHRLNREYSTDVFGRKLKNDGHTLNDDVVTILLDPSDRGKKKLIDIFGSGNPANAQWDVRPESEEPGNGTWAPAATPDRDGVIVDPGNTDPGTIPATGIDALVSKMIAAAVKPLAQKIAALEAKPSGGGSGIQLGDVVSFRNKFNGKLLCRDDNQGGKIQADDRDAAGDWEAWKVEKA